MSSKFNTERGEQLRETSDVNLRLQHVYTYTDTQVFIYTHMNRHACMHIHIYMKGRMKK